MKELNAIEIGIKYGLSNNILSTKRRTDIIYFGCLIVIIAKEKIDHKKGLMKLKANEKLMRSKCLVVVKMEDLIAKVKINIILRTI